MAETITDSFCERCGTRYTFEAAVRPRRARLGRVRVLTRGVTTFISNDGMPMAEALAAARSDEERADLARQLDAFHKTFSFCMGCRQYTCPSCWNAAAGECLTCSPDLTREVLPAAFPDVPVTGSTGTNGDAGHAAAAASQAWPSIDLERAAGVLSGEPEAEPEGEATPAVAATPSETEATPAVAATKAPPDADAGPPDAKTPAATTGAPDAPGADPAAPAAAEVAAAAPIVTGTEPVGDLTEAERDEIERALAADHDVAPVGAGGPVPDELRAEVPAAPSVVDPAVAGRHQTRGFLRRFRPAAAATVTIRAAHPAPDEPAAAGQSPLTKPVVEAAEPRVVEPAALAPAAASAAAATMSGGADEHSDLTADAPGDAPTAAPELAAPEPASAEPQRAVPPTSRVDAVAQPTWRMVAPDDATGPPAVGPEPARPAAWPASSTWPPAPERDAVAPAARRADAAPWAARLALSRPETSGLWAASSREVLGSAPGVGAPAPAAVQACVSCGLSLSATARFCRRCGSRQG